MAKAFTRFAGKPSCLQTPTRLASSGVRKPGVVGELHYVTEDPRGVEFFVQDGKGRAKAAKFEIVSKTAPKS